MFISLENIMMLAYKRKIKIMNKFSIPNKTIYICSTEKYSHYSSLNVYSPESLPDVSIPAKISILLLDMRILNFTLVRTYTTLI
jgi:hypothetical protein